MPQKQFNYSLAYFVKSDNFQLDYTSHARGQIQYNTYIY